MSEYRAPIEDINFAINEIAGMNEISSFNKYKESTPDVITAILEEAGKFSAEVLSPINRQGDIQGSIIENGVVRTPDGFKEAYEKFVTNGWNGMPFDSIYGGQNLPWLLTTAVSEMIQSANLSFALCPLLTQGAVELLNAHGSDDLKNIFLKKMVTGEWNGTMNLTEPQAGTDLAQIRTKARQEGEHYRIFGTKIYITYGEHDLTRNTVHMVLARAEGAPKGIRGISLFLVPKYLANRDGSCGHRNDLRAISLEHKLGIKASPTAVMSYGDNEGAIGYLIGDENNGIRYMFTMMNNARLAIGLTGVAVAERSYQKAKAFAIDRIQSPPINSKEGDPVPIIEHPDVKRMLLSMKSQTEATRLLAYFVAGQLDIAKSHPNREERCRAQTLVDLLIPVVKAWGSDTGNEVANIGIQIHGGMGFIEESGAPQLLRDSRIAAIYEGTNGIQATDLVGRKLLLDQGLGIKTFIESIRLSLSNYNLECDPRFQPMAVQLNQAIEFLSMATNWILKTSETSKAETTAVAVPYLRLLGVVSGGWLLIKSAVIAYQQENSKKLSPNFQRKKILSAQFFVDHFLVQTASLYSTVTTASKTICSSSSGDF